MLKKIMDIAEEAGNRILAIYESGEFQVRTKEDGSPVTRADLASHAWITAELSREFGYPVISEEGPEPPFEERKGWSHFFLVDPLDGTKDFIAQNNQFTVNIALIQDGKPVLGVVSLPAFDEIFFAESGQGAWARIDGHTESLPLEKPAGKILAKSLLHDNPRLKQFAEDNQVDQCIKMSSAVRLSRLAQGRINLCMITSRSKEWDIAAGHVLLGETGGRILTLQSRQEPTYNKPCLNNEFSIAFSSEIEPGDLIF